MDVTRMLPLVHQNGTATRALFEPWIRIRNANAVLGQNRELKRSVLLAVEDCKL